MNQESKPFEFPQYWKVSYKETRACGQTFNFKTIIRSKSKDFASKILCKKVEEDNAGSKVSSITLLRYNAQSRIKGKKISITGWAHIKNASFPNELNMLFKK